MNRQSIKTELLALEAELEYIKNASDEDVCKEYNVDCRQDIIDDVEFEIKNRKEDIAELDAKDEAIVFNDWLGWCEGDPDPAFSPSENINGMFYRR